MKAFGKLNKLLNVSKAQHVLDTLYTRISLTGSLSPGDQGLAKIADVKHSWCLDIIPVLLGKRVHAVNNNEKEVHSFAQFKYTPAREDA